ncbi:unnamed protein product [Pelagomonas calceolata]|uniref:Exostosin GT47 domain-containing protein n=1 Tax=Pelagomonas calceolata TaxID=35677 RepID=A0A8J2SU80_9STRA|nr:unnamed protein product [Pelagomonas calceolata]
MLRILLLATAAVASTKRGHKHKKPAAAAPPKLAYMAIPGAKDETSAPRACWAAPKSWREGLVDAYGSSVVVCSPEALRSNKMCACRLCPVDECVSRNALAQLNLDHALGVGSGRDSDALREFYRLTANASLVTNVPISEGHTTKREEMWGSLVDVVMSFLKTVKPPLKMKPCARPPSSKCAAALAAPPYQYAGAPRARGVRGLRAAHEGTFIVLPEVRQGRGVGFCAALLVALYGADRGNYSGAPRGVLDAMNLSSTFHGRVDDVQGAYCAADVAVAFPLHDRNPRVPTEALRAGRPVFASLEANLAGAVACQPFVGAVSWRDSRRNLIAAFQSWALNATAAAPAVFDAFAANCLDRTALFDRVWRVLERVKDERQGARRAVACEAPGACLRPTCGDGPTVEVAARACLGVS